MTYYELGQLVKRAQLKPKLSGPMDVAANSIPKTTGTPKKLTKGIVKTPSLTSNKGLMPKFLPGASIFNAAYKTQQKLPTRVSRTMPATKDIDARIKAMYGHSNNPAKAQVITQYPTHPSPIAQVEGDVVRTTDDLYTQQLQSREYARQQALANVRANRQKRVDAITKHYTPEAVANRDAKLLEEQKQYELEHPNTYVPQNPRMPYGTGWFESFLGWLGWRL